MSEQLVSVSRLHIHTDFSPACCDGAPFLPDNLISEAPKVLSGQISDAEWSTAMHQLQSITMEGIPSYCTQFWLHLVFGICTAACIDPMPAKMIKHLRLAVQDINARIFLPRGFFLTLQNIRPTWTDPGQLMLVIALNPEESQILQQENGIH